MLDETPKPLKVMVGLHHVIRGLDVALLQLSVGQTAEVVVPALYGYGSAGLPPLIAPHATCIYQVTVVAVQRKP